jgi:hypothetical protein
MPFEVPVALETMEDAIVQWRLHRERTSSLFRVVDAHYCTADTTEEFLPLLGFYGCHVCGRHHICNGKLLTPATVQRARTYMREEHGIENPSERDLGACLQTKFGIWCIPMYIEDTGTTVCAISRRFIARRSWTEEQEYMGSSNVDEWETLTDTQRQQDTNGLYSTVTRRGYSKKPYSNVNTSLTSGKSANVWKSAKSEFMGIATINWMDTEDKRGRRLRKSDDRRAKGTREIAYDEYLTDRGVPREQGGGGNDEDEDCASNESDYYMGTGARREKQGGRRSTITKISPPVNNLTRKGKRSAHGLHRSLAAPGTDLLTLSRGSSESREMEYNAGYFDVLRQLDKMKIAAQPETVHEQYASDQEKPDDGEVTLATRSGYVENRRGRPVRGDMRNAETHTKVAPDNVHIPSAVGDSVSVHYQMEIRETVSKYINYLFNYISMHEILHPGELQPFSVTEVIEECTELLNRITILLYVNSESIQKTYAYSKEPVQDRPVGYSIPPGSHFVSIEDSIAALLLAGFAEDYYLQSTQGIMFQIWTAVPFIKLCYDRKVLTLAFSKKETSFDRKRRTRKSIEIRNKRDTTPSIDVDIESRRFYRSMKVSRPGYSVFLANMKFVNWCLEVMTASPVQIQEQLEALSSSHKSRQPSKGEQK